MCGLCSELDSTSRYSQINSVRFHLIIASDALLLMCCDDDCSQTDSTRFQVIAILNFCMLYSLQIPRGYKIE